RCKVLSFLTAGVRRGGKRSREFSRHFTRGSKKAYWDLEPSSLTPSGLSDRRAFRSAAKKGDPSSPAPLPLRGKPGGARQSSPFCSVLLRNLDIHWKFFYRIVGRERTFPGLIHRGGLAHASGWCCRITHAV